MQKVLNLFTYFMFLIRSLMLTGVRFFLQKKKCFYNSRSFYIFMHFFSNEEKQYVGVQKNDFGHALHAVRFPPPPWRNSWCRPRSQVQGILLLSVKSILNCLNNHSKHTKIRVEMTWCFSLYLHIWIKLSKCLIYASRQEVHIPPP